MRTHTVGSALVAGPSWGQEVFIGRYSVAKFPRETREEDTQSERNELEQGTSSAGAWFEYEVRHSVRKGMESITA